MVQIPRTTPEHQGQHQHSTLTYLCISLFLCILCWVALGACISFAFQGALGKPPRAQPAHAAPLERHVQVKLNIVINQPGMQKDWPGYAPNQLVVPANSLVTVTLRDYDLGDTPLPKGSPFTAVQGIVGGGATVDGKLYRALAPEKVAHTFTIPQLNINVPLPGDAPKGASYDTITFTFHTGKAGTYTFQCFDPCGTGASGFMGPMMSKGYMLGTLTVQG
jgi:heme/copper-type cytochrome/quinol oxidase subunit 2